jgi:hypothetical protein
MTNEQLIFKFANGDYEADERISKLFDKKLILFAFELTNNNTESIEIVFRAFRMLKCKREDFDSIKDIEAFLYRTVQNDCLHFIQYLNKLRLN